MRTLIIENEKAAAELLTTIVTDYCQGVDVCGVVPTIKEGFQMIEKEKPQLVFLDIELDDGLSFDLLDMLNERDFHIIFTTAFDQYALKAFRYSAIDYILKPYTPKSVVEAVGRVEKRTKETLTYEQLNQLIDSNKSQNDRISLPTSKGIRMCDPNEISKLEASSSYCTVHMSDGEKILISKPLGDVEKHLPEDIFFRVHSSHTINIRKVKNVINQDGGYIELQDGSQVPLARRRKQEFINLLK